MRKFTVAQLVEDDVVKLKISANLERGPEVMFSNFKMDARTYYCHVYEEDDGSGVLIYIPSVKTKDIFRELETL